MYKVGGNLRSRIIDRTRVRGMRVIPSLVLNLYFAYSFLKTEVCDIFTSCQCPSDHIRHHFPLVGFKLR